MVYLNNYRGLNTMYGSVLRIYAGRNIRVGMVFEMPENQARSPTDPTRPYTCIIIIIPGSWVRCLFFILVFYAYT